MALALLFFALLTVSCFAPVSYQAIRLFWPRLGFIWRLLLSLVGMALGGAIAFLLVFQALPTYERGVPRIPAAGPLLYALLVLLYLSAAVSVGATIRQLFRKGLSGGDLAWRIPLAIALAGYGLTLALVGCQWVFA